MTKRNGEPNLIKHRVVLAAVNTTSRRLPQWRTADVDRRPARLTLIPSALCDDRFAEIATLEILMVAEAENGQRIGRLV